MTAGSEHEPHPGSEKPPSLPNNTRSEWLQERDENERRRKESLITTRRYLSWWLGVSAAALLIYALTICGKTDACAGSGFHVFSTGIILAAAAASLGGLLGFLFGIPRTLAPRTKEERDAATPATAIVSTTADTPLTSQSVNTNLEDISDWLTKILIGAGLVELQRISESLQKLANHYQGDMGNSELVVLATVINFSVWGFFSGYLLTRLFLTGAFSDVNAFEALQSRAGRLERENKELETRTDELSEQATTLSKQKSLLEKTAEGLSRASTGEYDEAGSAFREALNKVEASTPPGIKQMVVEGMIFNSLYKPAPGGFEEAISAAEQYLHDVPDAPSPLILMYQGFAYGQKYEYERRQGKSPEQLQSVRDAAYNAVSKAIALAPNLRDLARSVWRPPAGSEDRDLEVFKEDQGFIDLLGAGAQAP